MECTRVRKSIIAGLRKLVAIAKSDENQSSDHSYFNCLSSVIVGVSVVLKRTVDDSESK